MRKIICWIVIMLSSWNAQAQSDSLFVDEIDFKYSLAVQSTFKDYKLYLGDKTAENLIFQNSNLGFGVGIQYKIVSFILNFPVQFYNPVELETQFATGAGLNLYLDKFYLQGHFHYIENFNENNAPQGLFPLFQGDRQMGYGTLIGNYFFNGNQFSMTSAYKMDNRQKQSAGSWVLTVPFTFQYFIADSSVSNFKNIENAQTIIGGLESGYAYNYVYQKWSAMIMGTGGLEVNYLNIKNTPSKAVISPRYRLQGSFVYHNRTHYVGLLWQYLPHLNIANDLNTSANNLQIRLIVGSHFF